MKKYVRNHELPDAEQYDLLEAHHIAETTALLARIENLNQQVLKYSAGEAEQAARADTAEKRVETLRSERQAMIDDPSTERANRKAFELKAERAACDAAQKQVAVLREALTTALLSFDDLGPEGLTGDGFADAVRAALANITSSGFVRLADVERVFRPLLGVIDEYRETSVFVDASAFLDEAKR